MSHRNQSIRLAARRSEYNTHLRRRRSSQLPDHPQRTRGCLRQRFAERLALSCGGRTATTCARMRELPDSGAPERTINSRSGLKRRLPHQRHGFEIGMPPRRALCGKAEGQLNTAMARIIGDPTGTSFWASMRTLRSVWVRARNSSCVLITVDASRCLRSRRLLANPSRRAGYSATNSGIDSNSPLRSISRARCLSGGVDGEFSVSLHLPQSLEL